MNSININDVKNYKKLEKIRNFLSSGTEKANKIEEIVMKGRFWNENITHFEIKNICSKILYDYSWNTNLSIEDTELLLSGEINKKCSCCMGTGKISLI